jgi:hypothetical protein
MVYGLLIIIFEALKDLRLNSGVFYKELWRIILRLSYLFK